MKFKFESSSIKYKVVISIFHGLIILALLLPIIVNCLNDNNDNNNQFQSHPELTSDTQDATSNAADLPTDEPQSSPEPKDDQLEPPKELSVIRLNDTSVVLRWEFPEEHHEHLLYFKVQYKPSKKNNSVWKTDPQEISSVTRAYQINGLRPGNYFFIVTAVYDNQDNAPSQSLKYKLRARSKISPADLPEMKAPEIYWSEADSDFFRFKWRYDPKPSDTEDFGFLVYYRSAHVVSDFTIYNTLGTDVEIAELEPDTPYEAKVVAYNENGISEFSDPILIKTLPPKNGSSSSSPNTPTVSSTTSPQTSTTKRPIEMSTNHGPSTPIPTTPKPGQVTPKPAPGQVDSSSFIEPLINFFKPILTDQGDAMLVVRCLLLVLLPVLFITFGLILCVRPYRNKKDPCSSSPVDDVQFDLEINGYFKNSFPGVEKPYSPATNGVHTGFVNNHPHINDFESHTLFEQGGLPGSNFHPGSVS